MKTKVWLLPRPVFVNKAIALRCVHVHCIAAHACTHTHSSLTAISQANPVDSLPSPLDFSPRIFLYCASSWNSPELFTVPSGRHRTTTLLLHRFPSSYSVLSSGVDTSCKAQQILMLFACVCMCVCINCVYLFIFLNVWVLLPFDGEIKMYINVISGCKSHH